MQCEELAAERCPCLLADTAECSYCSLLRGEAVCGCDWQGSCAYERYRWRDGPPAGEYPAGTVVAVRPLAAATGLVLKAGEGLAAAPAGTVVKFRLPLVDGGREMSAVLLRAYPAGLVYLLSFDPCPAALLLGREIEATAAGNAFAGWQYLAAADDRTIVIAAASPLAALLGPLADGLTRRGNLVAFAPPGDAAAAAGADIVFAAGGENEIKRMATGLPPSFRGKIATWVTGG